MPEAGKDARGKGEGRQPHPERTPGAVVPGILLGEELYERMLRVFLGSEVDVACPMCG